MLINNDQINNTLKNFVPVVWPNNVVSYRCMRDDGVIV